MGVGVGSLVKHGDLGDTRLLVHEATHGLVLLEAFYHVRIDSFAQFNIYYSSHSALI